MTSLETPTVPGLGDNEQAALGVLFGQLRAADPANRLRQRLYDNQNIAARFGGVVPDRYYRMGICLGWNGKAVDALATRCNLDGFVWADGDLDDIGSRAVWDDNNTRSDMNSAIVSALLHGPAFLVNTVGRSGEPEALVHVRDAMNATGVWNARTRRLDSFLSIQDYSDDRVSEFALYLPNLTITARRDGPRWETERQEHSWGMPVEMLAYKSRVGRPFGHSRISRPMIGLQAQAVRTLIRLEGHSDVYSYPDFWLLGALAKDVKGEDGGNVAAMAAALGRIRGIPDIPQDDPNSRDDALDRAEVKQFPASSPAPNLAGLNALAKMFAREASLPDSAVAITDLSNPTSGDSYDASQYELISEAEVAVEDWSPAVRRSHVRALAMRNGHAEVPKQWASIEPRWRDPRYTSKAQLADAGLKQIQAVPWLGDTEVGLELLGLDAQQIRRALADKPESTAPPVVGG